MRPHRLLLPLLLFLCLPALARALDPADDPQLAIVRIRSHGASATIIATTEGRSWLLSCCHMFFDRHDQIDPRVLARPLKIDGPLQPHAVGRTALARVIAHDAAVDLSLLEIDNGPFNFVPVAKRGHVPSRHLWSCGYDEMRWPITLRRATLLGTQGSTTFTQEKPWHGRSGGGLIDVDGRCLVGVVQGYEVGHGDRGLYVSHEAILRFLERRGAQLPAAPPVFPPTGGCPNGQCPNPRIALPGTR